jgi:hypothetical protein
VKPKQLAEIPECPPELAYLWQWTCGIRGPISYCEIEAWMRVNRVALSAWEVEVIMALDNKRSEGVGR